MDFSADFIFSLKFLEKTNDEKMLMLGLVVERQLLMLVPGSGLRPVSLIFLPLLYWKF